MPLTHAQLWKAVDALAARRGLSPSGLARAAGLDATSFNPSKRGGGEDRPRWPSTESLMRVLEATGVSLGGFADLAGDPDERDNSVPLLGLARAGEGGPFDAQAYDAAERTDLPTATPTTVAITVTGDSMMPLYREGDRVVIDRARTDLAKGDVRKGDRVVVQLKDGQAMVKEYAGGGSRNAQLNSLNPAFAPMTVPRKDIDWMARIQWVSQ